MRLRQFTGKTPWKTESWQKKANISLTAFSAWKYSNSVALFRFYQISEAKFTKHQGYLADLRNPQEGISGGFRCAWEKFPEQFERKNIWVPSPDAVMPDAHEMAVLLHQRLASRSLRRTQGTTARPAPLTPRGQVNTNPRVSIYKG